MIVKDALESFIQDLIDNAAVGSPLEDAELFGNPRGPVTEAVKVVRVYASSGSFSMVSAGREKESELNVEATVQCYVLPEADTLAALDTAVDLSLEMARKVFEGIAGNPGLANGVCDANFQEFETGDLTINSVLYGCTWLDGLVNTAR